MRPGISAIAFDLDGTLYPNFSLYLRLIPFALKNFRFLSAFGKARDIFHENPLQARELALMTASDCNDFYSEQAALTAAFLGGNPDEIQQKIKILIYRGWEPYFKKVRLYANVKNCLSKLKTAGLKLGLLSDFPPETKIRHLGIENYWDAVLCSETCGALKPDPVSFLKLAEALDTDPSKIMYVGNSIKYDLIGAKRAGMQSALISFKTGNSLKKAFKRYNSSEPDFIFKDYRKLINYVLN